MQYCWPVHKGRFRLESVGRVIVAVQVKLTLLLTWDSSGAPDLYCHAEPLPPRPKPPVKLQVK